MTHAFDSESQIKEYDCASCDSEKVIAKTYDIHCVVTALRFAWRIKKFPVKLACSFDKCIVWQHCENVAQIERVRLRTSAPDPDKRQTTIINNNYSSIMIV
jgi:uncharacterized protein YifN (PemK superfamily)